MLSRPSQRQLKQILIHILLPLCLLAGLSGCISSTTTNPPTADPVVQDPDAEPVEPSPITPPEETTGPTSGLKSISAGGQHSCAIKNQDNTLWCWGSNENNQIGNKSIRSAAPSPRVISNDPWLIIVTSDQHSCGIDETGTLHCWGKNDSGQVGNGTTIDQETPAAISANTDWSNVSLGTNHSCATRKDNTLWCWGSNTSFQLGHSPENNQQPSQLNQTNEDDSSTTEQWLASSSGNSHTCAIKTDNSLWCWGGNTKGQIGQGSVTAFFSEPTQLAENDTWLSISANGDHNCAVRKDDRSLWCWGNNQAGQIGNGTTENSLTPSLIAEGSTWDKISLGTDHSCGIKDNGSLWCWGDNSRSQLGDGSTLASSSPKQIGSAINWQAISLGNQFSCAISSDGRLWCWGGNDQYQQGNAETTDIVAPSVISDDSDWRSISSGNTHSCAIKNDDSLWCWGNSIYGQVAQDVDAKIPTQEPSASSWSSLSANGNHSCAVKNDNSLWCWGFNSQGQLGNSSTTSQANPTPVVADSNWIDLDLGSDHACAIRDNGSLWCWGNNSQSQLGDGSSINSITPKQIGEADNWSKISLGDQFSCGIQTDTASTSQTLWCWGKNDLSQLGHSPADNMTPSQVDTAITWTTVSAGGNHACAIDSSNQSLYCWGDNHYGQLGLNSTSNATLPSQEFSTSKWLEVSSGGNHTCAIQDDDSLWCWGNNGTGQLGIGTTSHQPKPQRVSHIDELGWRLVSSGKDHTCAIDSDYAGHCWGLNDFGQVGNGVLLSTDTAKQFDASSNWNDIDSGALHSCGLKNDPFNISSKTLWCGGINNFGQLGTGSTANQSAPVQIKGPSASLENWRYVSTGHFHSCAITDTDSLYCWGKNSHGQLATDNDSNNSGNWSLLTAITAGTTSDDWLMISAGASHTCGIKNTDELWCWGDNATDQMGNSSASKPTQTSPIQVMEDGLTIPFSAKDVTTGGYTNNTDHTAGGHTCAIKTDGTLWCWGENDTSQLGEQTTTNRAIPTQIIVDAAAEGFPPQFNNSWVSIKAGNRFTCGLQTDQQLYCWGDHTFGQTGTVDVSPVQTPTDPDIDIDLFPDTSVTSPKPIKGNFKVINFAVGQRFACAIDSNNDLWCWGFLGSSQASLDADTQRLIDHTPVREPVRDEWQSLSLGMEHGCGIREDEDFNQSVYCWGDGAEFQFGDGGAWLEAPQQLSIQ